MLEKSSLVRGMNATAFRQAAECGAASAGSAAAGSLFPQFRKYCCVAVYEVMGQKRPFGVNAAGGSAPRRLGSHANRPAIRWPGSARGSHATAGFHCGAWWCGSMPINRTNTGGAPAGHRVPSQRIAFAKTRASFLRGFCMLSAGPAQSAARIQRCH